MPGYPADKTTAKPYENEQVYTGPERRILEGRINSVEEGIKRVQESMIALGNRVDHSLENVASKIDTLIQSNTRLHVESEADREIAKSQAAGILDLNNRVTVTDKEVNNVKAEFIKEMGLFRTEIAVMKQSLSDDKAEMEKRTSANRNLFTVLLGLVTIINVLIQFFAQHFKP